MTESTLLVCPVRGPLGISALAKDKLTPSEESRRIDLIKFLLGKNYPPENIAVETVVVKAIGEKGRNSLRCDVIVYDEPASHLASLRLIDKLKKATIIAELKRDSASKASGISNQLEPALKQLPAVGALGIYWDDVNRLLLTKSLVGGAFIEIAQDVIENLPEYKGIYKKSPLKSSSLSAPDNLVAVLMGVANVMRSHGINDEALRYRETVKLILARYCDEREAAAKGNGELTLQVRPGTDPDFLPRVQETYKKSAKRYSKAKTLFSPVAGSELPEDALRNIIQRIQGIRFADATSEMMQQVFMSFVPAVFKKSLDQYFTPASLISCMTDLVRIGPNDKIADPGMGTADFLTSALMKRLDAGDDDIDKRIFGMDIDARAYDLAVINMILHKDGQTGLACEDSIQNHSRLSGEMDVVLCNPPFGERSVERRASVLKEYKLGHRWEQTATGWQCTEELLESQQLGILFLERCFKLLSADSAGGRLAIILPEGYLCTTSYGYVRQWILDNLRVVSLIELPRRIFLKSDADLRSSVLICQKVEANDLAKLKKANYPIHAELVRKVGYKLGGGFSVVPVRDAETGEPIRDADNKLIPDTHFTGVTERGLDFAKEWKLDEPIAKQIKACDLPWHGARLSDVLDHRALDLKARRLTPNALEIVRDLKASNHVQLSQIAELVVTEIDLNLPANSAKLWKHVEGQDIRAIEGTVIPQEPSRGWQISERKNRWMFRLVGGDIIIGLVRPERRNVGMLVLEKDEIAIGASDGIAVLRLRAMYKTTYPAGWLFSALRSEASRIQFWVESGGTSYGKLTDDHINGLILADPGETERKKVASNVDKWFESQMESSKHWEAIGSTDDRRPILNSPIFGLEWPGTAASELDTDDVE